MPRDMSIISRCAMLLLPVSGGEYGNSVIYIHIGVGSALLVSINWAMREPLECETSNRYRFSRFSFYLYKGASSPNLENL